MNGWQYEMGVVIYENAAAAIHKEQSIGNSLFFSIGFLKLFLYSKNEGNNSAVLICGVLLMISAVVILSYSRQKLVFQNFGIKRL
ncbi:hypothetical protein QQG55_20345 [Brugia pahangi]